MSEADNSGEFSVYQTFEDGTTERVRTFVPLSDAFDAFRHYTTNVAVTMGIVKRVIMTDRNDFTVMEWQHGHGYTVNGGEWYPSFREFALTLIKIVDRSTREAGEPDADKSKEASNESNPV